MISIVIPTFNALAYTQKTIESLEENTTDFELILVDDGSTDGTWEYLTTTVYSVLRNDTNLGVSASWNRGIKKASNDYVCIANSDILFTKGWDKPLIKALNDRFAVASPFFTDGNLPSDFPRGMTRRSNFLPVLGSCFMVNRKIFEAIGYFPESLKYWYGDNWLGDSAKSIGLGTIHCANSYIHHFGSKSANAKAIKDFSQEIRKDKQSYDALQKLS